MRLEAGLRVQDYILVERLGAGAFGEVWKAAHAHLPRIAAIKFATSDAAAAALLRDGVAQFGLEHAGIVKVLDANLSAAPPYVILEYVEGKSLRQVLRECGRLEIPYVAAIFRQLAEALAHAHEKGAIHGDLKPENILVTHGTAAQPPVVKITDFQLGAYAAGERPPFGGAGGVRPSLETRGPLGTYRYLAPEQELGQEVDARADIFSLGVVLFEMLTGTLPQGRDLPSDLEPSISWWWDHIFARCYTGRERRYRDVRELLADLAAVSTGPRWGEMPSQRPAAAAGAAATKDAKGNPAQTVPPDAARGLEKVLAAMGATEAAVRQGSARRAAPPRPARGPSVGALLVGLLAVLVPFGIMASITSIEELPLFTVTPRATFATLEPQCPPLLPPPATPGELDAVRTMVGKYIRLRDKLERVAPLWRHAVERQIEEVKAQARSSGLVLRVQGDEITVFRVGERMPLYEARLHDDGARCEGGWR